MAGIRDWGGQFVVPIPAGADRWLNAFRRRRSPAPSSSSSSGTRTSAASSRAPSAREEFARARPRTRASRSATSRSTARRGTLRGLHFQAAPHEEAKLVRCTRGRDLRRHRRPAPRLADLPPLARGRAHRRQPAHALRPRGLRARLPDARRRHRGALPDVRVLPSRVRARRALGRSGVRHRLARAGPAISARDRDIRIFFLANRQGIRPKSP